MRVVVAAVREVVEPAGEVDRVGARERDPRRRARRAPRRSPAARPRAPRRCGAPARRRCRAAAAWRAQLHQVVRAPGPAEHRRQVVHGRLEVGHEPRAARACRAAASSRPASRSRPAGRGRRASRAGSRRSCSPGAGTAAAARSPRRARPRGRAIAPVVSARLSTSAARSSRCSAMSPTRLRGLAHEAPQLVAVAVQLLEQPAGRHERRVEVEPARGRVPALARVLARRAAEHAAQRRARVRSSKIAKISSRSTFDVVSSVVEHRAVRRRCRARRPLGQPQVDVAAGRARQAELADLRVGAARAAAPSRRRSSARARRGRRRSARWPVTVPTCLPAISTSPPFTTWPAFRNRALSR